MLTAAAATATRNARILAAVALYLLPLAVFFRPLFLGQAFVPADLLRYVAPWSHNAANTADPSPAAWNVLRFDGIAEFYPWRTEAARQVRDGRIPLWNEHAFAAYGGTPLLADSQSAPLYPLNWLFCLFPPDRLWYAFGLAAALHLLIAAKGVFHLLRSYRLRRSAATLGAVTWTLSAPIVCWLSLPTFLAVACWLPWLLLNIRRAHEKAGTASGRLALLLAGLTGGLMLLAGHLQMAMYGLLAAGLYAVWLGIGSLRERATVRPLPWLGAAIAAGTLTVLLALPQVLPTLELSRVSHRVGGQPTLDSYRAYLDYALPPRNLVTLLVPNFFGHPNPTDTPYWNTNNYGEWAAYVGVAPLLLAVFTLALPWRGPEAATFRTRQRGFWAALAALSLLLAMGSPLNLPFFFLVPGYSQTGNPARSLFLFALAVAALTALGLDALLDPGILREAKRRAGLVAIAAPLLIGAFGASRAAAYAAQSTLPLPFGPLMAVALPGIGLAGVLFALAAILLFVLPTLPERQRPVGAVLVVALAAGDLFAWGCGYNPTSPPDAVYPVTPGIAFLQKNAANALIAPINRGWSLGKEPPRAAVLPPNALTVFGLHDVGGYDSLFPGAAKNEVRDAGQGEEPSPPENGNIVFVKQVGTAVSLGARYLALSPDAVPPGAAPPPPLREAYRGNDLIVWENPAGRQYEPRAKADYRTDGFRVGLFCGMAACAALAAEAAALVGAGRRRRRGTRVMP